jgi:hypothetical protein
MNAGDDRSALEQLVENGLEICERFWSNCVYAYVYCNTHTFVHVCDMLAANVHVHVIACWSCLAFLCVHTCIGCCFPAVTQEQEPGSPI